MNQVKAKDDHGSASALEEFIGYNMKRAYVVVYEDFRAALGEDGLAPRVFSALALVVQHPNITQSAVAQHLGIERSGLVAIVDELESQDLVIRGPVPGDRRAYALTPTKKGLKTFDAANAAIKRHEDKLFAEFSSEEKETLTVLLRKVRKAAE